MEVAMEEGGESGCSSTTSIDEYIGSAWNNWAPVIDWEPFSVDDDFDGLIKSMICDDYGDEDGNATAATEAPAMTHEPSPCYSFPSSTTTSAGTPPGEEDDDKGLRLVHLLTAAAEALAGTHKDLARVILVRLKELVPTAAAAGRSNMERLAVHFTDALQGLLDGTIAGGGRHAAAHRDDQHQMGDVLAAYQLLQDMAPYAKFGHLTANQAILEAVSGDRRVHIVDFDIMEGVQWASLMQALVSRQDGTPPPHLRITAITRGGGGGRGGMGTVQETGRRLVAFAASIGQPFSFGQCRLDPNEQFRPTGVKVVRGEAVVANCVLHGPHLPRRTAGSVASFLAGAAALGARVVALVEEEDEAGGEEVGFVGRFMDELHRYSAVCDSLEAGFPMQGNARGLVERVILGPAITGAVGRAYRRGEGAEEGGWGEWAAAMGFGRVGISSFNHCQARLLLGLFNEGYRVEEGGPNKLVLGWKSRRLLSASVWSAPPPPSSPPGDLTPSPEDSDYFA